MDADARAWLERELVAALGFSEVGDIAGYIADSLGTAAEVAAYLVELLGIPSARAAAIGARLFPSPAPAPVPAPSPSPSPLVARPVEANSRLKPAKNLRSRPAAGARSARVTNCVRCGRVEHNAGRKCGFCGAELRYEALPAVEELGQGPPATAAASARGDRKEDAEPAPAGTAHPRRNPDLPRDALELLERAARRLARDGRKQPRPRPGDRGPDRPDGPLAPRARVVLTEGGAYGVATC